MILSGSLVTVTVDGMVWQPWARSWQGPASGSLGRSLRRQDTCRAAAELS